MYLMCYVKRVVLRTLFCMLAVVLINLIISTYFDTGKNSGTPERNYLNVKSISSKMISFHGENTNEGKFFREYLEVSKSLIVVLTGFMMFVIVMLMMMMIC